MNILSTPVVSFRIPSVEADLLEVYREVSIEAAKSAAPVAVVDDTHENAYAVPVVAGQPLVDRTRLSIVVDFLAGGGRYVGQAGAQWDGFGIWTRSDGSRYQGHFRGGARTGIGLETRPDGTKIGGCFSCGDRPAGGTVTRPNGSTFTGVLLNGNAPPEYAPPEADSLWTLPQSLAP